MATLAIDDLVLYSLRGFLFDQRIISTYAYRVTAITGAPDLFAALDALLEKLDDVAGVRATYLQCCPPEYLMQEAWAQRIAPTRMRAVRQVVDLNGLFAAGEARTANVSAAITRRGDPAIRQAVSSLHVPIGQSADEIANGKVTVDLLDELNEHAATLNDDVSITIGTTTFTPVIPNPGNPSVSIEITEAFVQDTVRVMRRRTVRLGE